MWLVTRERRILGSENGDRGRATEGGRKRAKRRERERTRGRVRGWPVARVPARVRE